MDDRIRTLAYVLGIVCGLSIAGVVVLAACGCAVPDFLKTIGGTTSGGLVALLAYAVSKPGSESSKDSKDDGSARGGGEPPQVG